MSDLKELEKMIYRRKSTRSYTGKPVDEAIIQKIKEFTESAKPLFPHIKIRTEIIGKESVKSILPWITPQLIAIFSEEKEGFLENAGFIYQQLDLYVQSLGLGVCWIGMGKYDPKENAGLERGDGLKFVIMLAFGYPRGEALRNGKEEFKRKLPKDISDRADNRLEPARYAPSSVNSQPWYFTHETLNATENIPVSKIAGADSDGKPIEVLHAYCVLQGIFKKKMLGRFNRIDMGIALAHLYVTYPDTFRFFKVEETKEVKGYQYVGSFFL